MAGEQSPFDRLATEGYVSTAVYSTLGATRSAQVSTMPRQVATSTVGTTTVSGTIISALATCSEAGTYSALRFSTGATAPVLTDCRAGVWNGTTGAIMAQSDNYAATVALANSVFEIPLQGTLSLVVGDQVFLGLGLIGTTIGTYFGAAGNASINSLYPQITRLKTGWVSGPLTDLSSTSSNGILWAELVL